MSLKKSKAEFYLTVLEKYNKDRNTSAFYKTRSFKKIWNFIEDFIKKEKFVKFVLYLRKKYDIPKEGFKITGLVWSAIPNNWKHKKDRKKLKNLEKEIENFFRPYHLASKDWLPIFTEYLFYDKIFISPEANSYNLCYVTDILTKCDSTGQNLNEDIINAYPVALLINPRAGENDITDYVKKVYMSEIKPLQKKYDDNKLSFKIGKSRTKKKGIQKRNDFIYRSRNLPLSQIMRSFKTSREVIDEGHIGAIKSQEIKKRKQL